MVGILSLMPTAFGVGFDDILPALPLPFEVESALVSRHGTLGELLRLVEALETQPLDSQPLPRGLDQVTMARLLVDARPGRAVRGPFYFSSLQNSWMRRQPSRRLSMSVA